MTRLFALSVAAAAFSRLPADYPELIPLAARWLDRESQSTILLEGLRKYGPRAKDAVPALLKVLRGPERPYHGYMAGEIAPDLLRGRRAGSVCERRLCPNAARVVLVTDTQFVVPSLRRTTAKRPIVAGRADHDDD
jgi:hypothetical protein